MTQLAHNGQLSSEGINLAKCEFRNQIKFPSRYNYSQLVRFLGTTLGHSFSNSDGANQLIPAVSLRSGSHNRHSRHLMFCPSFPFWFDYASLRVWECDGKILIAALGMRICFLFCILDFVPASVKCRIWHYMTRISLLFRIILRKFRLSLLNINTVYTYVVGRFPSG